MAGNPGNTTALPELSVSATERAAQGRVLSSGKPANTLVKWKYPALFWTIAVTVHLMVLWGLVHQEQPVSTPTSIEAEPVSASRIQQDGSETANPLIEDTRRITRNILNGRITEPDVQKLLQVLDGLNELASSSHYGAVALSIPPDTLELLAEFGLMDAFVQGIDESAENANAITRLPAEMLDEYRSEFGIPSIPDRNTWILTDNLINLPLPGGGNISGPENFAEFGLKF